MPDFGYKTLGTAQATNLNDCIVGSLFTITEDGEAQSITAGLAEGTGNVKCAIYKHSDGALVPNSESEAKNVSAPGWPSSAWTTFNIPGAPSLVADTEYILVAWADAMICLARDAGADDQSHLKTEDYGTWPDPTGWVHTDEVHSIYCTYEEEAPPAKKTLVQAALIAFPPLIVLPTLREILRLTGGC